MKQQHVIRRPNPENPPNLSLIQGDSQVGNMHLYNTELSNRENYTLGQSSGQAGFGAPIVSNPSFSFQGGQPSVQNPNLGGFIAPPGFGIDSSLHMIYSLFSNSLNDIPNKKTKSVCSLPRTPLVWNILIYTRSQKNQHLVCMWMVTLLFPSPANLKGVPNDATEREVSHIFRPYPGFVNARLIAKKTHEGRKFFFCFVDFENKTQASIAMQTLQGYKFHNKDPSGVRISFATPTNEIKKGYGNKGGYFYNQSLLICSIDILNCVYRAKYKDTEKILSKETETSDTETKRTSIEEIFKEEATLTGQDKTTITLKVLIR